MKEYKKFGSTVKELQAAAQNHKETSEQEANEAQELINKIRSEIPPKKLGLMCFRGKENARKANNGAVSVKPKKTKQQLQMDSLADKLAAKYGGKKGKVSCVKFLRNF